MPYEIFHRSVFPEVDGYVTLCSFLLEFWSNSHRGAYIRACLHGGGGPQVGEVPCLCAVKSNPPLHAILQPRHREVHFLKVIEWSLST